ncbi:MAG: hypothetical protein J7K54_04175 [Candidatus Aenigmarchaeota archaeon]|nr:hypothetical protein [Candidatus Aenigmarchaeota archaeon]
MILHSNPEDMGVYRGRKELENAYRFISDELKGLRLPDDEMAECIKQYSILGASVSEKLMRRHIANYDKAVAEGAITKEESESFMVQFAKILPLQMYSTLWALDREEMKSSDEYAKKRAEEHFRNLNDPDFFMESYFS